MVAIAREGLVPASVSRAGCCVQFLPRMRAGDWLSLLLSQGILGERGVAPLVRAFLWLAMGQGGRTRGSPRGIV
jgi:hypothetical protein